MTWTLSNFEKQKLLALHLPIYNERPYYKVPLFNELHITISYQIHPPTRGHSSILRGVKIPSPSALYLLLMQAAWPDIHLLLLTSELRVYSHLCFNLYMHSPRIQVLSYSYIRATGPYITAAKSN